MHTLFTDKHHDTKYNAQNNLEGLTHYVDDDTLRFHKARVVDTFITDGGLLFCLIESVALDPYNNKRGFRHAIFDIFGKNHGRIDLDHCSKTRKQAEVVMWEAVNSMNAAKITREGIQHANKWHKKDMTVIRAMLKDLKAGGKI